MTHLGSSTGTGRIHLGDKNLGPTEYRIDVSRRRNLVEGRGTISADPGMLWNIHESQETPTLQLEGGDTVEFLIARGQAESGQANIVTSEAIPGALSEQIRLLCQNVKTGFRGH